ncbi:metallophosphoesterase family protein [Bradyrhizobium barranii]|uniref:metallophosphoesterase family protein n=1 Tax=Bradyrhizobium TaxID=374 RepID=UPI003F2439CF
MRVLAISDLHLERRALNELPYLSESFDVLVCAGDIWEGEPQKAVQCVTQIARGKPALIVPGNHEFWTHETGGHTIADVIKLMRNEADRQNAEARRKVVTVLSADSPTYEIDDTRFIGLTLWGDWAQASRWMWGLTMKSSGQPARALSRFIQRPVPVSMARSQPKEADGPHMMPQPSMRGKGLFSLTNSSLSTKAQP